MRSCLQTLSFLRDLFDLPECRNQEICHQDAWLGFFAAFLTVFVEILRLFKGLNEGCRKASGPLLGIPEGYAAPPAELKLSACAA